MAGQLHTVCIVDPLRAVFKAESGQVTVAVLALFPIRKILRRQEHFRFTNNEFFGQSVYQIDTVIGRSAGRNQNAVVITRDRIRGCRGREATQTVAQQPAVFLRPGRCHHILFSIYKFHGFLLYQRLE